MIWLFAALALYIYLAIGNVLAKFIIIDFNDDTDTRNLPIIRKVFRRLVFPERSYSWPSRAESSAYLAVEKGGLEKNRIYISGHTILWPFLRAFPFATGVSWFIIWSVFKILQISWNLILRSFDIMFSWIFNPRTSS